MSQEKYGEIHGNI